MKIRVCLWCELGARPARADLFREAFAALNECVVCQTLMFRGGRLAQYTIVCARMAFALAS